MIDWEAAFAEILDPYRAWLADRSDGALRLKQWEQRFIASPEPAVCEATTWSWLRGCEGLVIEPAEDPSYGGPDYRCLTGADRFYVEVTCVTSNVVTGKSGIPEHPHSGGWSPLTGTIFQKCWDKRTQLDSLVAPCLLAICTLHGFGAMTCFDELGAQLILTGDPTMAWNVDAATGRTGPTRITTDLKQTAFLAPDYASRVVRAKRRGISGVLLFGSSMPRRRVVGALHPQPFRIFDPRWLPSVAFCRLRDGWQDGHFAVEWVDAYPEDEDMEGAWDAELGRRVDAIRQGTAIGRPAEDVFPELRDELP